MASLIQMASWIPLLVAGITIVGGVVAYRAQKRADRRNQLIELRRAAYREYMSAFITQISPDSSPDTLLELQKREFDLFLVASDDVIRSLSAFSKYGIETSYGGKISRDVGRYKGLLADVILSMRKDCFERSEISPGDALKMLPMQ